MFFKQIFEKYLGAVLMFQAKFQMDCELERRTVEMTKNRMHEEMLRNMARKKARQEFELERERKIKEMEKLTETISEDGIAMAETNARLSRVHDDLKNAFKMMRVSYYTVLNKKGKISRLYWLHEVNHKRYECARENQK